MSDFHDEISKYRNLICPHCLAGGLSFDEDASPPPARKFPTRLRAKDIYQCPTCGRACTAGETLGATKVVRASKGDPALHGIPESVAQRFAKKARASVWVAAALGHMIDNEGQAQVVSEPHGVTQVGDVILHVDEDTIDDGGDRSIQKGRYLIRVEEF